MKIIKSFAPWVLAGFTAGFILGLSVGMPVTDSLKAGIPIALLAYFAWLTLGGYKKIFKG
jgi:hypothetical protein